MPAERDTDAIQTLEIIDLAHDGRGVAIAPTGSKRGTVVFVPGALPGQKVKARITAAKKNYWLAELAEAASPGAIPPICPHWRKCGGCPLQRLPYAEQLRFKEKTLLTSLQKIGRLEKTALARAWLSIAPAPLQTAYRNKAELAFGTEKGRILLGFKERNSHTVVDIRRCALLPASAQPIIGACREIAGSMFAPDQIESGLPRFLTLRYAASSPASEPAWHATLITRPANRSERKKMATLGEKLMEACPELDTFSHEARHSRPNLAIGERRILTLSKSATPPDRLFMALGGQTFAITPQSFFQVNSSASQLLAATAQAMDKSASGPLLDVYCGAGAPGQLLAPNHEECLGMDLDTEAVSCARDNAHSRKLARWRYAAGNAARLLPALAGASARWRTALLDPPRSGLEPESLRALLALAPEHVIYISCNPATFARDAAALARHYELASLAAVDMFPNTAHVECCSLWKGPLQTPRA